MLSRLTALNSSQVRPIPHCKCITLSIQGFLHKIRNDPSSCVHRAIVSFLPSKTTGDSGSDIERTHKASSGVMTNETSKFDGIRCNIPTIASNDFWTLCSGVPVWTFQSTKGSWIKHNAIFGIICTNFSLACLLE